MKRLAWAVVIGLDLIILANLVLLYSYKVNKFVGM